MKHYNIPMKTFGIIGTLLFTGGIAWLAVVHPFEPASVAEFGTRLVYVQGRRVAFLGEGGAPEREWKASFPVRQVLADGERLGLVPQGSDVLYRYTPDGREEGRIAPPQKADGRGRWARMGEDRLFLDPGRQALFILPGDGGEWRLMLPPEEELTKPADLTVVPGPKGGGPLVCVLCSDPPQMLWYTGKGEYRRDYLLERRKVPSVRYFIVEDWADFLKPQRAVIPARIASSREGELLVVYRTKDDKYRRLVYFRDLGDDLKSRGVLLPVKPRSRWSPRYVRPMRSPREAAFHGRGLVMSGRHGGLWYFPNERMAPVKPWVEPPREGSWTFLAHERGWGWLLLAFSVLSFILAVAARDLHFRITGDSVRWSVASLAVPGLGQVWAGRRGWAALWFVLAVLWAGTAVFLLSLMRQGIRVTSATFTEALLGLAVVWVLSAVQSFLWGIKNEKS